jgi:hypothetical protein
MKVERPRRRWRVSLVLTGLILAALALVCVGCDGVTIDFEVKRLVPKVLVGFNFGGGKSTSQWLNDTAYHDLPPGSTVWVDSSGEALMRGTLDNNQQCTIYVFRLTSLETKGCPKSQYTSGNTVTCQQEGTAAYKECNKNTHETLSGKVEIKGSWLSLTYLPERQLTLVIVAEGTAQVWPVTQFQEGTLGDAVVVEAQQFLYTAPDDVLQEMGPVAGIPPRQARPVEELPPLVGELGIDDWIGRVVDQSRQDGTPIDTGPGRPPPPSSLFVVHGEGGPLGDRRVQEAVAQAVDWPAIISRRFPDAEPVATLQFPDLQTLTSQVPFDLDQARALLAEAGYPDGFLIVEVVSEQDSELVDVAEAMIGYLSEAGLEVKFLVQPPAEVAGTVEELLGAEQAVLRLAWE